MGIWDWELPPGVIWSGGSMPLGMVQAPSRGPRGLTWFDPRTVAEFRPDSQVHALVMFRQAGNASRHTSSHETD